MESPNVLECAVAFEVLQDMTSVMGRYAPLMKVCSWGCHWHRRHTTKCFVRAASPHQDLIVLLRRAVYVDAGRLEPGGDLAGDAITEDVARMLPPELLQQRRAATTKTGGGGTAVAASLDSVAMLARYPRHGVGSKSAHTFLPLNTQAAGW